MLDVLFFGRVREQLGCTTLEIPLSKATADLDSLQLFLCEGRGAIWEQVLSQSNIIRAINQTVADGNQQLIDGDEVAFFGPVTGG